jgi:5-carboxymethyl-2-hydroxymuconate isomerase
MPHLILEYSSNVYEKDNLTEVLSKINKFLTEMLPTELANCKSRAIEYNTFCLGDGNARNAFVHVNLQIMPGRDIDKLTTVGNGVINILKDYFHQSTRQLNLQITLEIVELTKTYFKLVR